MWRQHFITREVPDARPLAGDLFRRSFGHEIPDYPRHFVLVLAEDLGASQAGRAVAYTHFMPLDEVYLGGGMCVDERVYRQLPREVFRSVRDAGGLATILLRDATAMLGDSPAAFGHVGEPRARQADLRSGFVATDDPHVMVLWRRELPDAEKARLVAKVKAFGAF